MSRAQIQAISKELSESLAALHDVVQEAKSHRSQMIQIVGKELIEQLSPTADFKKSLQKLGKLRASQSLLQWKLRKYLAGNASYIGGADLNALRSFLKMVINMHDQARVSLKAQASEKEDYKNLKKITEKLKRLAEMQKAIRKMAIAEGKAIRDDKPVAHHSNVPKFSVGDRVVIVEVPDDEYHEDWPFGAVEEMCHLKGKFGTVVDIEYFSPNYHSWNYIVQMDDNYGDPNWTWHHNSLKKA